MTVPADRKARVLAAVARTPSLVRADVRREIASVAAASFGIALVLFFAFGGWEHTAGRPRWFFVTSVAVWSVGAVVSMVAAWRAGAVVSRGSAWARAAVAAGTPLLLYGAIQALVVLDPAIAAFRSDRIGIKCHSLTLVAGAVLLYGLAHVRRSSDPRHPVASGAALGVASGACAGSMVVFWCPIAAPMHFFVGHVLPLLLLGAIGARLGARVIAVRDRPETT